MKYNYFCSPKKSFRAIFNNRLTNNVMDLSPVRQNCKKLRIRQIFYHSLKEHPLFCNFAKFGCKIF